jgi:thioredoxin-like negative regulator of GroEL
MERTAENIRADYLAGVDALLRGEPEEALRLLEPLAANAEASTDVRLATAKAYLEARRAEDAESLLAALAGETALAPGLGAYLELLRAVAAALGARPDEARSRLEKVTGTDPRMEYAAHQLRRRVDNDRPPAIRF